MFVTGVLGLFIQHNMKSYKRFVWSLICISLWPVFWFFMIILLLKSSKEYYFQFIETSEDTFIISFAKSRLTEKFSKADQIMSELNIPKYSENTTVGHYFYNGKTKREVIAFLESKGWKEIILEQQENEE